MKGVNPMKKTIAAGVLALLLTAGCATMMSFEEREKTYGKEAPAITEAFAAKQMKPGDVWKIYLKAADPGGDMHRIAAVVNQPGMGPYPISFTKIPQGNGKELSGYVYLNTLGSYGTEWQNFLTISVTVQVQDRAGHFSEPVSFPLTFQTRYTQEPPPPGKFKEDNLGPILVELRPPDGGLGSSFY
jgi:hypothetical protein